MDEGPAACLNRSLTMPPFREVIPLAPGRPTQPSDTMDSPSNDVIIPEYKKALTLLKSMEDLSLTARISREPTRKMSSYPEHLSRSLSLKPNRKTSLLGVRKAEKFALAKEIAEEAIKQNKVFTVVGPYNHIRNGLRARGWVEKFYKIQGVSPGDVRINQFDAIIVSQDAKDSSVDRNDDDQDDVDADDNDDGQNKMNPWLEEDGIYGMMSRIVRGCQPSFIWTLRTGQIDFRMLKKDQIVNHHAKAGAFTTKVGLCKIMRQMHWFADDTAENCFPRCYALSSEEERQEFIDDFRLTACISILKTVVRRAGLDDKQKEEECTEQKENLDETNANEDPLKDPCAIKLDGVEEDNKSSRKVVPKIRYKTRPNVYLMVPEETLHMAIRQCELFLQSKWHEDIDTQENTRVLTDASWDMFLENYYKVANQGAEIPNARGNIHRCKELLNQMQRVSHQSIWDGEKNIWIAKPGAQSRGRGISCHNNLNTLLQLQNCSIHKQDLKYVVQKYIESPYLVYNTKFDIRQWFLVSEWNPLTIWWYQDCYLRFCSQQFTLEDFNESVHLSNNSIQYKYANGPRSPQLPSENMWDSNQFVSYLRRCGEANTWDRVTQPRMRHAVVAAMLCAQDSIEIRKNCFELYGADFMLTEDLTPWLIEINASPCMAPSTSVTARMTENVLEDTLKVILDRRKDRNCDVGRYELIYKQEQVDVPPYVGIDLTLTGKGYRRCWNAGGSQITTGVSQGGANSTLNTNGSLTSTQEGASTNVTSSNAMGIQKQKLLPRSNETQQNATVALTRVSSHLTNGTTSTTSNVASENQSISPKKTPIKPTMTSPPKAKPQTFLSTMKAAAKMSGDVPTTSPSNTTVTLNRSKMSHHSISTVQTSPSSDKSSVGTSVDVNTPVSVQSSSVPIILPKHVNSSPSVSNRTLRAPTRVEIMELPISQSHKMSISIGGSPMKRQQQSFSISQMSPGKQNRKSQMLNVKSKKEKGKRKSSDNLGELNKDDSHKRHLASSTYLFLPELNAI